MIPILYSSTATDFTNNGYGRLADCTSCIVTEERNGDYLLEMTYPVNGKYFEHLAVDSIIGAKPNKEVDVEHFRVISVNATSLGSVTVVARQIALEAMRNNVYLGISYAGLGPSSYVNLGSEAEYLWNNTTALVTGASQYDPATFPTLTFDGDAHAPADTDTTPRLMQSSPFQKIVFGAEGSLIDKYGGELKYHDYTVYIMEARGENKGVKLVYGKNITGIQQMIDLSETYDGFMPYLPLADPYEFDQPVAIGDPMHPQQPVIWGQYRGTYAHSRVFPLDVSGIMLTDSNGDVKWDSTYNAAVSYVAQHPEWGLPDITTTVQFVPLGQTEEYRHLAEFESLSLCDTVLVYFPALGVNKQAKVVKTIYNTLREKYDSIEIGTLRQTLAQTIASIKKGR